MDLTVNNFAAKIKLMRPQERSKLCADNLINLILQLCDNPVENFEDINKKYDELNRKILSLATSFEITKVHAADNAKSIKSLKKSNETILEENVTLKKEVRLLTFEINNVQQ